MALTPLVLLAPAVSLFGLIVIMPIFRSVLLSLYEWNGIDAKRWAGFDNYRELLSDPVFHTALANNLKWLLSYALAPVLGLGMALFLNQRAFGMRLVRSLFFMPFVISQVVVGLIFTWFFHSQFGLLNQLLALVGMPAVAPLDSENWAIFAVILAGLWPQTAYCMILYQTGLTGLNGDLIDAGRLDGARGITMLRRVILPQLRPVSFIVAMVCVVSALRSFDLVMIMTLGGPYNSSTVLAYYMYEACFLSFRFGYAAAIATILFLLMSLCVGFFLQRMLRREMA